MVIGIKWPNLYLLSTNRSEEMEDLKRKMNAKLLDLEEQLEAAQSRASQLEKTKTRLQGELEDTMVEVDRVRFLVFPTMAHKSLLHTTINQIKPKLIENN